MRYKPDKESSYHRAGSETGSAYINGSKEPITRPRVRHEEEDEVELTLYKATVEALIERLNKRGLHKSQMSL